MTASKGVATKSIECGWILFGGISSATLEHQKEARAAGVPATTFNYCHMDKLPKKDEGKHEPNDCGKWLIAEKDKRHAKAVDGAWLKDHGGDTK